ncbi:hypothetical protein NLI96_g7878 [Meripilus lineatus]|uniref:F-box domain-containing protein n=1 Tax=Meripilus lineatus TaxID=2056292 RepID=A0AAD5YGT8_9APHY|nr:hypothetical protein NLI96_g7878 [Physisporinus lineatus]
MSNKRPREGSLSSPVSAEEPDSHQTPSTPACAFLFANVFPLELVDYIGSFLWDSFATLQAVSLTCRDWHTTIRPCIFRALTINSEHRLKEVERLLDSEPTIAFWIRELRLKPDPSIALAGPGWGHILHPCAWMFRFPIILPWKLKKLRAIELIGIVEAGWKYRQMAMLLPKFSYFKTVKSLSFIDCRLPKGVIASFISVFPSMNELRVINTLDTADTNLNSSDKLPRLGAPQLTSLHLQGGDDVVDLESHGFLTWMDPRACLQRLKCLQIRLQHPANVRDFGRMLTVLGPSLQHLDLTISYTDVPDDSLPPAVAESLDCSNLLGLCTMHLKPLTHPAIHHFLSNVKSPILKNVQFSMCFPWIHCLKVKDYVDFDEHVSSASKALQEVLFLYTGPLKIDHVMDKVHKTFSKLSALNVIRVLKEGS